VPPEVVQRKRENGQTASEIGSELADNLNLMAVLSGADFGFMGAPGAAISVPEEISAAKASGAAAEIDSAIRGLGEPNGPLIVRLENDLGAQLPAVSPEPPPSARLILDAGPPFHLIKQGREGLVRSAEMRRRWEKLWGQEWPIDPDTGRPQIVHHTRPVGDGGLDHETNIEHMTQADHIRHHGENGDSVRWGRRRWQNLQNWYGQNWQPGDKD
jgi:hypothetical protein